MLERNLKHIFHFQWSNELNKNYHSGNKLRTYRSFKTDLKYEKYLDFELNYKKRKNITKLRISAHSLEIERGRYKTKNGNILPVVDRLCTSCSQIEDERHLLLHCNVYDNERLVMINKISDIFPSYTNMNEDS